MCCYAMYRNDALHARSTSSRRIIHAGCEGMIMISRSICAMAILCKQSAQDVALSDVTVGALLDSRPMLAGKMHQHAGVEHRAGRAATVDTHVQSGHCNCAWPAHLTWPLYTDHDQRAFSCAARAFVGLPGDFGVRVWRLTRCLRRCCFCCCCACCCTCRSSALCWRHRHQLQERTSKPDCKRALVMGSCRPE